MRIQIVQLINKIVYCKIKQAHQNESIQQAQSALEIYAQKIQLLTQNYQLRQEREQYLYQQQRDDIADKQWQKTFDEQVKQNEIENEWKQKQYDYQKQRDKVADSQWQKQYNLQKKNLAKSSSRSSSKKSKSSKSSSVNKSNSKVIEVPTFKELADKTVNVINKATLGIFDDIFSKYTKN